MLVSAFNDFFRNKLIVLTHSDGAAASGLYVAMSSNIENVKKERKSAICTFARLVRRYRHQFATKEVCIGNTVKAVLIFFSCLFQEQLKFLWEATENFLRQHNLYEMC